MKKILFLVIGCIMPVFAVAQSTCETRVDAHQRATTKQRVAYCLNPDATVPNNAYAGLVFSGVSAHYPQPASVVKQEPLTTRPGSFEPEEVTLARDYIETMQFPQTMQSTDAVIVAPGNQFVPYAPGQEFSYTPSPTVPTKPVADTQHTVYAPAISNDFVDTTTQDFVYVPSPTVPAKYPTMAQPSFAQPVSIAQQGTDVQIGTLQPVERSMADEVDSQGNLIVKETFAETKAGVKARQTKPGRQFVTSEGGASSAREASVDQADTLQPYAQDISVGTQSYAPAVPNDNDMYEEIPVGTQSYAPATSN